MSAEIRGRGLPAPSVKVPWAAVGAALPRVSLRGGVARAASSLRGEGTPALSVSRQPVQDPKGRLPSGPKLHHEPLLLPTKDVREPTCRLVGAAIGFPTRMEVPCGSVVTARWDLQHVAQAVENASGPFRRQKAR